LIQESRRRKPLAKMLAYSDAIARGDASPPPIARLIGFDLISVKPGEAVVEFQATEAHANDIADIAMEVAYSSNLDEGESFTTLELKINFLKPVWRARLKAVGEWSNRGARWDGSSAIEPTRKGAWWHVRRVRA
jgi:acyl-coenzyme A thioesterase PaaI-like protein